MVRGGPEASTHGGRHPARPEGPHPGPRRSRTDDRLSLAGRGSRRRQPRLAADNREQSQELLVEQRSGLRSPGHYRPSACSRYPILVGTACRLFHGHSANADDRLPGPSYDGEIPVILPKATALRVEALVTPGPEALALSTGVRRGARSSGQRWYIAFLPGRRSQPGRRAPGSVELDGASCGEPGAASASATETSAGAGVAASRRRGDDGGG